MKLWLKRSGQLVECDVVATWFYRQLLAKAAAYDDMLREMGVEPTVLNASFPFVENEEHTELPIRHGAKTDNGDEVVC